jgi:hypothetical protein
MNGDSDTKAKNLRQKAVAKSIVGEERGFELWERVIVKALPLH